MIAREGWRGRAQHPNGDRMTRRDTIKTGFGKRGREAKVPERSQSSIERLKAVGNRWWGKIPTRKRSAGPSKRSDKPRG
jgi:hypothetical protein